MEWFTPTIIGQPPSCRSGHSASLVGTKMFMFGGYENRYLNDLHTMDTGFVMFYFFLDISRYIRMECHYYTRIATSTARLA